MQLLKTNIEDVNIIEPSIHEDSRGYFVETYQKEKLANLGIKFDFVQDNQSCSKNAGTIRGLHYQENPKPMTKLVRVISGAIYDVAVDIRKGSPTFGKYVSAYLDSGSQKQILIPRGFAHGFCTLKDNTIVSYKVDNYYDPRYDRAINWEDPEIGIEWPSVIYPVKEGFISLKDQSAPFLKDCKINFEY